MGKYRRYTKQKRHGSQNIRMEAQWMKGKYYAD